MVISRLWKLSLFFGIISFILAFLAPVFWKTLPYVNHVDPHNLPYNFLVWGTCIVCWIVTFISIFFHNWFIGKIKKSVYPKKNLPLYLNIPGILLLIAFIILFIKFARDH